MVLLFCRNCCKIVYGFGAWIDDMFIDYIEEAASELGFITRMKCCLRESWKFLSGVPKYLLLTHYVVCVFDVSYRVFQEKSETCQLNLASFNFFQITKITYLSWHEFPMKNFLCRYRCINIFSLSFPFSLLIQSHENFPHYLYLLFFNQKWFQNEVSYQLQ